MSCRFVRCSIVIICVIQFSLSAKKLLTHRSIQCVAFFPVWERIRKLGRSIKVMRELKPTFGIEPRGDFGEWLILWALGCKVSEYPLASSSLIVIKRFCTSCRMSFPLSPYFSVRSLNDWLNFSCVRLIMDSPPSWWGELSFICSLLGVLLLLNFFYTQRLWKRWGKYVTGLQQGRETKPETQTKFSLPCFMQPVIGQNWLRWIQPSSHNSGFPWATGGMFSYPRRRLMTKLTSLRACPFSH